VPEEGARLQEQWSTAFRRGAIARLRATQNRSRASGSDGEVQRSYAALQLAQAIGIECMGQKNADADEGKKRCYDLDHSLPPEVEMPGRARLRNAR
jgi:hypothetical protein